eukprot:TRINITY_DN112574_c0_g1_i1.p1 TRINITY_DN112574_c0_g1~~TRINITY_DN112574_c0_g1_i1.p1  ORF type:complete len:328 (+),score=61.48 TRINITY_DN112574_c0_g1_i1:116-1099(+)
MWIKVLIALLLLLLFFFGIYIAELQLNQDSTEFLAPRPVVKLQKPQKPLPIRLTRIPNQLVLTSKDGTLHKLAEPVQANIRHTLQLNPGITVRWLGDFDCQRYLARHYQNTSLPSIFADETRGSYRSDICRAAVLAREGGFYTDVDVEMNVSFEELAGKETTFLAAYSEDNSVLNALLGAVPGSAFMQEVLNQIILSYRGEPSPEQSETTAQWMGPITAYAALQVVAKRDCPEVQELHPIDETQFRCGSHVLRMFQEQSLECWNPGDGPCTLERYESDFLGVKFGIFHPSGSLVAWPRFAACKDWGCQTGGWPQAEEDQAAPLEEEK